MKYPELTNTPIKETVFSVSYEEVINDECLVDFIKSKMIKHHFKDVKPAINQELKLKGDTIEVSSIKNGFSLRNNNEIIQLRKGSFSFHYLNGYKKYSLLLNSLKKYWDELQLVTENNLKITSYSVRYINVIETDEENQPTHLIQLYPKQSKGRHIHNFQNSVQFSYNNNDKYIIDVVSTKLKNKGVLLDITVNSKNESGKIQFEKIFEPLQEIKNKVFFDSITARALLKYLKKEKK